MNLFFCLIGSTRNPVPLATLTGHTTPVASVNISAELGIVISASEGELVC